MLLAAHAAMAAAPMIPSKTEVIEAYAYYNCTDLTGELVLPESVHTIGEYAFANCTGLTGEFFFAEDDNVALTAFEGSGVIAHFDKHFLYIASEGEAYIYDYTGPSDIGLYIPATLGGCPVTGIASGTFQDRTDLTGVLVLPDTLEYIGANAFQNCYGLTGTLDLPDGLITIGDHAFDTCYGLEGDLVFPASLKFIGASSFAGSGGFVGETYIPSQTTVDETAFDDTHITPIYTAHYPYSLENGEATITAYTGPADVDLHFPAQIDGYPVVAIDAYALADRPDLTGGVYLPEGIRTIGNSAFSGCINLSYLDKLPDSLETLGSHAFYHCKNMQGTLYLPPKLNIVPMYAFANCSSLTGGLTIPESIYSIGYNAFDGCSGFNGELVFLGDDCGFSDYAFRNCSGLTGVLRLPYYTDDVDRYCFANCTGLTGLVMSERMYKIENHAFYNCSGMKGNLILPDWIHFIGTEAFYGCSGFTGELILPSSIELLSDGTFDGCSGFTGTLVIPDNVRYTVQGFAGCSGFTGLVLPQRCTAIGEYAFDGCTGLTGTVKLPQGIGQLYEYAFRGTGLSGYVLLPDSLFTEHAVYKETAFAGSNLTPLKVSDLEKHFRYYVDNNKVTISGYSGPILDSFVIPDTIEGYPVTRILATAFQGRSDLKGPLTLPDTITEIGGYAFENCSGLTGILNLPENLKTLGSRAFYGCTGFTGGTTVPETVQEYGNDPFGNTHIAVSYATIVSLTMNECPTELLEDQTLQLGVTAVPVSASSQVRWISSDTSIATVSSTGLVRGVAPGKVTITAVSLIKPTLKASVTLKIGTDTNYRALIIGQTYPGTSSYLPGCDRDAYAMAAMLESMTTTPYSITVKENLTKSGMLSAIRSAFSGAKSNDVSVFYYSGHGSSNGGRLVGTGSTYLSFSELRSALDDVPGKKIVILDSCHSGHAIGYSLRDPVTMDLDAEMELFNQQAIEAFSSAGRTTYAGNNLAASSYYVLTAARSTETSVSIISGNIAFGAFTYTLLKGSGLNERYAYLTPLYADTDSNGRLTMNELVSYIEDEVPNVTSHEQNIQHYPSSSSLVFWGK